MNIGVLASHEGTTLQAIIDACAGGRIAGRVTLVICNNVDAGALRRAAQHRIPALYLSSRTHEADMLDDAITRALIDAGVDLVFLAGYMKKLGTRVLEKFAGHILNTHPALLPKYGGKGYYGNNVHDAVLAAGEAETGVTIHVVTAEYDAGPIVAQRHVPVQIGDTRATLAARVQACERELIVETLASLANGTLTLPL